MHAPWKPPSQTLKNKAYVTAKIRNARDIHMLFTYREGTAGFQKLSAEVCNHEIFKLLTMKCKVLLFVIMLQATFGFGQNLVPNPSFEEYTECPSDPVGNIEIEKVYPWKSFRQTPDFFHPCDESGVMSSPWSSALGYGVPFHGEGKAGFAAVAWFFSREILGVELTSPMDVDQSYFVSFRLLRTFGGGYHANCNCASNNVGLKFTMQEYSVNDPIHIANDAHIFYEEVIADSSNWTEVSGWFIADSAYSHLAIGTFFDNDHIVVENYNNYQGGYKAYYFVDAVCVTKNPADCDELRPVTIEDADLNSGIKVFPNPTTSTLFLETERTVNNYFISDITGRLILNSDDRVEFAHSNEIDVSHLSEGLYILVLQFENEQSQSVSFLKQ